MPTTKLDAFHGFLMETKHSYFSHYLRSHCDNKNQDILPFPCPDFSQTSCLPAGKIPSRVHALSADKAQWLRNNTYTRYARLTKRNQCLRPFARAYPLQAAFLAPFFSADEGWLKIAVARAINSPSLLSVAPWLYIRSCLSFLVLFPSPSADVSCVLCRWNCFRVSFPL